MTPDTLNDLIGTLGPLSGRSPVRLLQSETLLQTAWEQEGTWAVIPFEQLEPRWKVIAVDGKSPYVPDFDPEAYALSVPLPDGDYVIELSGGTDG